MKIGKIFTAPKIHGKRKLVWEKDDYEKSDGPCGCSSCVFNSEAQDGICLDNSFPFCIQHKCHAIFADNVLDPLENHPV